MARKLGGLAHSTFIVILVAVSLVTVFVPVTSTAEASGGGPDGRLFLLGPCVIVGFNPPGVMIGDCAPPGGGMPTTAEGQNTDVTLTWEMDLNSTDEYSEEDRDDIESVQILRGFHPSMMKTIAETQPDTNSFLDEDALVTSPGEAWYQVIVEFEDGSLAGEPVHVSDYEANA